MTQTPKEHDSKLAALYEQQLKIEQRLRFYASDLLRLAGAEYRYVGRRRVPDITLAEAIERIRSQHPDAEGPQTLAEYVAKQRELRANLDESEALEESYTGWSRFFLVTSSSGHIHSSMSCSSCYPTTTYGWLPELSGDTESAAVARCGPALCSVCFPSAPVEHQAGSLTQSQTEAILRGETFESNSDRKARVAAERAAKAQAKLERKLERARKTVAKVDAWYAANGGEAAVAALDPQSLYQLACQQPSTVCDQIFADRDRRDYEAGRDRFAPRDDLRALLAEHS